MCKCKSECVCAGRAEQLVMTLSSPCYSADRELLGVAAVDLTLADMFAGAEHFAEGELSYAFVIDQNGQYVSVLSPVFHNYRITSYLFDSEICAFWPKKDNFKLDFIYVQLYIGCGYPTRDTVYMYKLLCKLYYFRDFSFTRIIA